MINRRDQCLSNVGAAIWVQGNDTGGPRQKKRRGRIEPLKDMIVFLGAIVALARANDIAVARGEGSGGEGSGP
jgi:hypothetical protein